MDTGRGIRGLIRLISITALISLGVLILNTGAGASTSSIWSATAVPSTLSDSDTSAVELGVKFQSSVDGVITALRFYKSSSNTGTHVGNLWTAGGTLLASVTFTNETASGWQQMSLPTSVPITANTTYVVSYHTNVGRYSANSSYFNSAYDNPPLRALATAESGGNGVYRYGATSAFPNQTYNATNYWVDVVLSYEGQVPAGPEPAGWYAGDLHVHRSCGGAPIDLSTMYGNMGAQNLSVISLLADMGNGEVQNPVTDLPLVNGQDDPVSTAGRIVHWDAEWHWDATYTQYPHQALGGHILALGLTKANQIWDEYTFPIIDWAHQQERHRRLCAHAVSGRRHPAGPRLLQAHRVPGRSGAGCRPTSSKKMSPAATPSSTPTTVCSTPAFGRALRPARTFPAAPTWARF